MFHFKYFISSFQSSLGGGHGNRLLTDEEHLQSHSGNLYELKKKKNKSGFILSGYNATFVLLLAFLKVAFV